MVLILKFGRQPVLSEFRLCPPGGVSREKKVKIVAYIFKSAGCGRNSH